MAWAPWPKADEKGLARYVLPSTADELRLAINRDDLLAQQRTRDVVAAIYDALCQRDIRYAREPYDAQKQLQIIRTPSAMLRGAGEGTCLDLALLFAGACLGNELLPLVVLLKGHALVAVSLTTPRRGAGALTRQGTDGAWAGNGMLTDGATLRQLAQSDAYLLVECTGFAETTVLPATVPEGRERQNGRLAFERAVLAGREQLDEVARTFAFALDAAVLQDVSRIVPYEPGASLDSMSPLLRERLNGVVDAHEVFGGRDAELARLDAVVTATPGYVFITGPSGSGKTALLANWVRRLEGRGESVAYHFISQRHDTAGHEDTFRTVDEQLVFWHQYAGPKANNSSELEGLFLKLITTRPPLERLVVVIDGLDEADGWTPLSRLFPKTLAAGVSVVLSARETGVDWVKVLGLNVRALIRLDPLDEGRIADLLRSVGGAAAPFADDVVFVRTMHQRSKGDSFYLQFLVHDLLEGAIASTADLARQPNGIDDYLEQWWDQISQQLNSTTVRDLLGYLVVSRGALMRDELATISPADALDGFSIDTAIKSLRRFVTGSAAQGFSLCHPRLHEYIATQKLLAGDQQSYRDRLIAWCGDWAAHPSPYALKHYVGHLNDEIRSENAAASLQAADTLTRLVADEAFQTAYKNVRGDVPALVHDVESALPAVASSSCPLQTVVAAAVNLDAFRARWVRPESVFESAADGRLDEVVSRLEFFAIEEQWRQAVLLLAVWLAPPAAKGKTEPLFNRVMASLQDFGPLPLLAARVSNALKRGAEPPLVLPYHPGVLPHAPAKETVEQIVVRMGGSQDPAFNISGKTSFQETSRAHGDETPSYLAEGDAPDLVAYAQANPLDDGTLRQYIVIHSTNPYADYRNRSLWAILGAVLCHKSPDRALEYARLVAVAALAPAPVRYREGLRLAATALLGKSGDGAATLAFSQRWADAETAANKLAQARYKGDSWGHHRQRLALCAEIRATALGELGPAIGFLEKAAHLPFGFAGYNAPANLTVAESNGVCRPLVRPAIDAALAAAVRSAHNVQEAGFCARTTARVNAMRERWWTGPIPDLPGTVARFVEDPFAVEFAPLHHANEDFGKRSDGKETLEIPPEVRNARTLRQLAEDVYHVQVAELQLMNQTFDPDAPLPLDAVIALPDRKFAPLLAARFAAEVLAQPLPKQQRVDLIRRLVPVASANQTTLDTVLARLLLAEAPTDPLALTAIRDLAPDVWMDEPAALRGAEA